VKISGYRRRYDACSLAAQAFRATDAEDGYTPRLWSLVVFFELYLAKGAAGTRADFGPPAPVSLKEAKQGGSVE
jgi:hypothetical protein